MAKNTPKIESGRLAVVWIGTAQPSQMPKGVIASDMAGKPGAHRYVDQKGGDYGPYANPLRNHVHALPLQIHHS